MNEPTTCGACNPRGRRPNALVRLFIIAQEMETEHGDSVDPPSLDLFEDSKWDTPLPVYACKRCGTLRVAWSI